MKREEEAEGEGSARGKEKYKFVTISTGKAGRNSNTARHREYITLIINVFYIILCFYIMIFDNYLSTTYFSSYCIQI